RAAGGGHEPLDQPGPGRGVLRDIGRLRLALVLRHAHQDRRRRRRDRGGQGEGRVVVGRPPVLALRSQPRRRNRSAGCRNGSTARPSAAAAKVPARPSAFGKLLTAPRLSNQRVGQKKAPWLAAPGLTTPSAQSAALAPAIASRPQVRIRTIPRRPAAALSNAAIKI